MEIEIHLPESRSLLIASQIFDKIFLCAYRVSRAVLRSEARPATSAFFRREKVQAFSYKCCRNRGRNAIRRGLVVVSQSPRLGFDSHVIHSPRYIDIIQIYDPTARSHGDEIYIRINGRMDPALGFPFHSHGLHTSPLPAMRTFIHCQLCIS